VVDTFTFDAADRLITIADTKGVNTLFSATYARDNANQLTSDSSAPANTGSYKYTALNQVCYAASSFTNACSSPPSGSTPYNYDAADNLTQTGTTLQAFNNADEVCWTATTSGTCTSPPSGATRYTYDARGNRTQMTPPSGGATTLSYDQANRLTSYGSAGTYAYNGDGLRMNKTVSGTTSQFLWDVAGSPPALIKDSSTLYIYGPGGQPMEQINGSTAIWLHHDQLGSIRLITDGNGVGQATYAFDVYGNLASSTGAISNPIRFAGEYRDAESGFYYLRARYYDPSNSQFISRDPAVQRTGEPYGYGDDNPLNATDPTGLLTWSDLRHAVRGVGGLPSAVAQAAILQLTSFDSLPIYGGYYFSYSMNKSVVPKDWTPVRFVFSHAQRVFLGYDETLDEFQRVAGYPGGRVDDEGISVTPIPSLIYPTVDSSGNWRMSKWSSTLWQTAGPGCHNGKEDFAD
jgi:RHS repeat-associated protein